jgi:hypothetical protein
MNRTRRDFVCRRFAASLLRAAVTRDAEVLLDAERPEDPEVEGEGAADVTDAEIDVLDSAPGYGTG